MGKDKYRVLVVSPGSKTQDYFDDLLPRSDFERIVRAGDAGEARRILISQEIDIVIINAPLPDEYGVDLALDISDGPTTVMLMVASENAEQVAYKVEEAGVVTVAKPNSRSYIYGAVRMLAAVSRRLGKMEKKNRSLQEKMADIRVVNRAKWLLISNHNMTEDDAHYYIEKQAMDMRMSRREVAEQIINTYDK